MNRKIKYKDYDAYLKSNKWKEVKNDWYDNNTDRYQCRISLSHIDDVDMVLHHWRYPKDWNDDSHENLIFISVDMHEWIHSNFHDEHLEWGNNGVVMYMSYVMYERIQEVEMLGHLDIMRLQNIIKIKENESKDYMDLIEELNILKNHFRSRAEQCIIELESKSKSEPF